MSLNDFLNRKRNYAVVDDEKIREQYLDNLFNQARVFKSDVTPKEQKTDEILTDIFNNISKLANELDAKIANFGEYEDLNIKIENALNEGFDVSTVSSENITVSSLENEKENLIKDEFLSLEQIPYYYNLISNKFNLTLKNKLTSGQIDKFNSEMDYVLRLALQLKDLYDAYPEVKARFIDMKYLNQLINEIENRSYKLIKFSRKYKMDTTPGVAFDRVDSLPSASLPSVSTPSESFRAPSVAGTEEMADFAGWTPQDIRRLRGEGKKKGLPESEMIDIQNFKKNVIQNKKKMINLYDDRKNNPYID